MEDIQELQRRLARAEALLEALQGDEVDAVLRKDGVALLRLRHEEQEQRRAAALSAAMNDINKAVHSSLDGDQIMQSLLTEGARALGSETAAVSLREDGAWKVRYVHGLPGELVGVVMSDSEARHATLALETGMPVAVNDAFEDDRCNREHMRRYNVRSVLLIPLFARAQPLGVLFFNYHTKQHHFTETETRFGQQLAGTASVALDNARLLRELRTTEKTLRESEARLKQAMAAGQIFSFEWDPKSDAVLRSEHCTSILGIAPATCARDTGENFFRHIHDDDRSAFVQLLRGLTPAAPSYETTYRYARGDGRNVWLEESGRAEFAASGELVRVRGISSDVTRAVEAAERERETVAAMAAAQTAMDIVNAMGEGVILLRLDGTIQAINPAVEVLTALRREAAIGVNLRTLLPRLLEGKDLALARRALEEVAQGRLPTLDYVVLRRDTVAPITISPSVVFITSPAGTPVSAVLSLKDVTELHQAAELLNRIFDNTHMQIVYLDTDFNFVRINRAYAEACGQAPEFFTGKNHFDLFPHPENEALFRAVRDTGEPVTMVEKAFEFPDQPERGVTYWDWSLRPIRNEKGTMAGLLCCLLDVTQRVRARQALAESEQKYRELVENANSIIIRVTPDLRILYFNEYAQRFFGFATEEVMGKSVMGTIVPTTDSEGRDLREMVRTIAAHPELYRSNDNENICKDGRRVWVHWSNRALRDEQGAVREILCVGSDMTEARQLARTAENYRRRLQRLAERLTATEEQTRRRVATQIHDTVVQSLSLSNIRLGGVMTALDEAGLAAQREQVAGIRRLLDQGTKECRGLMEELVPSLLYEVGLHAALRAFAEKQAGIIGTNIHVAADGFLEPTDNALRGLLFQCARELIMNAAKHAGSREIRVTVSSDDRHIRLRVQDHGRGFDPAELDGQLHDQQGGFGLFHIRERVEGLGGRLEIESAPGKGTTARVVVPAGSGSGEQEARYR